MQPFLLCNRLFFLYRDQQVVNSSWAPSSQPITLQGAMTDLVMVDCSLPQSPVRAGHYDNSSWGTAASGLTLTVSNDGIHESEETLNLIVYDSACMDCNVTSGCTFKVGID